MLPLTLNEAKAVYRQSIDATVSDAEGEDWWQSVTAEVNQVVASKSAKAASYVIAWWHADWTYVSDRPIDAAKRIRAAAKQIGT